MAEINREKLLSILSKLNGSMQSSETIPILNHYSFKDKEIITSNFEMVAKALIPNTDIDCAIPRQFFDLISLLKTENIELKKVDDKLLVHSKGHRSKIPIQDNKDFPSYKFEIFKQWKKIPEDFIDGISYMLLVFESKTDLSQVRIAKNIMIGTEGFRILKYRIKGSFDDIINIDGDSVREIIRLDKIDKIKSYSISESKKEKKAIAFKYSDNFIHIIRFSENDIFKDLKWKPIFEKFKDKKFHNWNMANKTIECLKRIISLIESGFNVLAQVNLEYDGSYLIIKYKGDRIDINEKFKFSFKNKFNMEIHPKLLLKAIENCSKFCFEDKKDKNNKTLLCFKSADGKKHYITNMSVKEE